MGMVTILFSGTEPLQQTVNTLLTEGSCKIWWKLLWQVVSEKKTYMILYMYIAQGQGQIALRGQNFDCN